MSKLSTHVLDTMTGKPASGVSVTLEREKMPGVFAKIASSVTDADGRVKEMVPPGALAAGHYRLLFAVGDYFKAKGAKSFYRTVPVEFHIEDASVPNHVPLLLSPFGYSTYRGS